MIFPLVTWGELYRELVPHQRVSFENWIDYVPYRAGELVCPGCGLEIEVTSDDVSEGDYALCSECVAFNT